MPGLSIEEIANRHIEEYEANTIDGLFQSPILDKSKSSEEERTSFPSEEYEAFEVSTHRMLIDHQNYPLNRQWPDDVGDILLQAYGNSFSKVSNSESYSDYPWYNLLIVNPDIVDTVLGMAIQLIEVDAEAGSYISGMLPYLAAVLPGYNHTDETKTLEYLKGFVGWSQEFISRDPNFAFVYAPEITWKFASWSYDALDGLVKTSIMIYDKQGKHSAVTFLGEWTTTGANFRSLYISASE